MRDIGLGVPQNLRALEISFREAPRWSSFVTLDAPNLAPDELQLLAEKWRGGIPNTKVRGIWRNRAYKPMLQIFMNRPDHSPVDYACWASMIVKAFANHATLIVTQEKSGATDVRPTTEDEPTCQPVELVREKPASIDRLPVTEPSNTQRSMAAIASKAREYGPRRPDAKSDSTASTKKSKLGANTDQVTRNMREAYRRQQQDVAPEPDTDFTVTVTARKVADSVTVKVKVRKPAGKRKK